MDQRVALEGSDDATFATDAQGRVVGWNRGAEHLLGYGAADALGKSCPGLVGGWDIFGNRYCRDDCNLRQMIRRKEPLHGLLLDVCPRSGEFVRVRYSVAVVRLPGPARLETIHRLEPAAGSRDAKRTLASDAAGRPAPGVSRPSGTDLTPREVEVLRLLSEGCRTREVARILCVSVATVRTHVQNLLGKLQVHSRLEAVALARRRGFIRAWEPPHASTRSRKIMQSHDASGFTDRAASRQGPSVRAAIHGPEPKHPWMERDAAGSTGGKQR
jgi:PAS domain S-box-containing protein